MANDNIKQQREILDKLEAQVDAANERNGIRVLHAFQYIRCAQIFDSIYDLTDHIRDFHNK
jgi:hypothetical protein